MRTVFLPTADVGVSATAMDWNVRTLLRSFLLAGGLVYLAAGVLSGTPSQLVIGGVAAALGAFGLWWEFKQSQNIGESK